VHGVQPAILASFAAATAIRLIGFLWGSAIGHVAAVPRAKAVAKRQTAPA
jgi:hypothetical protein